MMESGNARPLWLRMLAATTAMSFTWSFVLAAPAQVLAEGLKDKKTKKSKPFIPPKRKIGKAFPPPASLKENMKPLTEAQLAKITATPPLSIR